MLGVTSCQVGLVRSHWGGVFKGIGGKKGRQRLSIRMELMSFTGFRLHSLYRNCNGPNREYFRDGVFCHLHPSEVR